MGSKIYQCSFCKKEGADVKYKDCTGIKVEYLQDGKKCGGFSTDESGYFCDSCFKTVQNNYKKKGILLLAERENVQLP